METKKMNEKRALKNLAKVARDVSCTIYYQHIDNNITLVSDGLFVVSIGTDTFNTLNEECFSKVPRVTEITALKDLMDKIRNEATNLVKMTPLIYEQPAGYDVRIYRIKGAESDKYLYIKKIYTDILDDLNMSFSVVNGKKFNTPIINVDAWYHGFACAPMNMKTAVENLLS